MKVLFAFFLNVLFNFAVGLVVAKFLGPEEYGRFALALATAVVVQTAFLDWLRLGATRFYSERSRGEDPRPSSGRSTWRSHSSPLFSRSEHPFSS